MPATTSLPRPVTGERSAAPWVAGLCWVAVLLDGFDLVVLGAVMPTLLDYEPPGWSAGVGRVGAICGPLLGGALLTAGYAVPWGFYLFAVVGALGALAISTARDARAVSRTAAALQEG